MAKSVGCLDKEFEISNNLLSLKNFLQEQRTMKKPGTIYMPNSTTSNPSQCVCYCMAAERLAVRICLFSTNCLYRDGELISAEKRVRLIIVSISAQHRCASTPFKETTCLVKLNPRIGIDSSPSSCSGNQSSPHIRHSSKILS